MGKRSSFERVERDYYPTPPEAVVPLLPHLAHGTMFAEPCAGDGALVRHLEAAGMSCLWASDIAPQAPDIAARDAYDGLHSAADSADFIITNPPWDRATLHRMIVTFSDERPTWLLFDADWIHTRQAAPYLPRLRKVVSVGRVKWIWGSPFTGKDNCAWHLFDKPDEAAVAVLVGRAA
ncbi:hypothetical protein D3218_12970 [Aureimonas flava]|uniref:Class I SAM-dependent methyltransferase n=2 Tax=Aureimonas flava TaxID=2320271 RepID=A0A3A1WSL5_9HYPH|nr:hypothetical protein D3218_12970 [Aureimonas flava]